ncbi:hypothetical protein H4219_005895 [Mycoemilia scoparia]|uniref:Uncharacterized protein n=1 Tax=Mycoemilia scoparia TaxID=417184 RepID=A0A9W7ZMJ1_9FUNG|nr:hypothetical protein H4219_005895 [Mycoemilia scoparia]
MNRQQSIQPFKGRSQQHKQSSQGKKQQTSKPSQGRKQQRNQPFKAKQQQLTQPSKGKQQQHALSSQEKPLELVKMEWFLSFIYLVLFVFTGKSGDIDQVANMLEQVKKDAQALVAVNEDISYHFYYLQGAAELLTDKVRKAMVKVQSSREYHSQPGVPRPNVNLVGLRIEYLVKLYDCGHASLFHYNLSTELEQNEEKLSNDYYKLWKTIYDQGTMVMKTFLTRKTQDSIDSKGFYEHFSSLPPFKNAEEYRTLALKTKKVRGIFSKIFANGKLQKCIVTGRVTTSIWMRNSLGHADGSKVHINHLLSGMVWFLGQWKGKSEDVEKLVEWFKKEEHFGTEEFKNFLYSQLQQ